MEDLNINVIKGFKIKAKNIKKEKSSYVIYTESGTKIIKKSPANQKSLLFQNEVKKHLYENGFTNTDMYYISSQEKPFFEFNNENYVMTDHIDGRNVNFSDNEDLKKTLAALASMHSLMIKFDIKDDLKLNRKESLYVTYGKKLNELGTLKKRIKKQSKLSDFDIIFLKNYDFYTDNLKRSLELLKSAGFDDVCEKAENENQICHNMIKEEYIYIDRKGIIVTNFNESFIDTCIIDLADIIKRYIKSFGPNHLSLKEILNIYTAINPLSDSEIKAVQPLLLYPAKFIKICTQYYAKRRTWVPSALNSRINDLIEKRDIEKEYIDGFYNL